MLRALLLFGGLLFFSSVQSQSFIGLGGGGGWTDRAGLRASIPFEYSFNPYISVQSELNFAQRRNRDVIQLLIIMRERDYRQATLNYLSIPVLAKFKLPFGQLNPYVVLGPEVAYGVSLNTTYVEDNRIFTQRASYDDFYIDHWDFGMNFGIGMEKVTDHYHKIFLECRFYLGIYDYLQLPDQETFNENSTLVLGFSYALFRKEKE